jgi:hypothetical protein
MKDEGCVDDVWKIGRVRVDMVGGRWWFGAWFRPSCFCRAAVTQNDANHRLLKTKRLLCLWLFIIIRCCRRCANFKLSLDHLLWMKEWSLIWILREAKGLKLGSKAPNYGNRYVTYWLYAKTSAYLGGLSYGQPAVLLAIIVQWWGRSPKIRFPLVRPFWFHGRARSD